MPGDRPDRFAKAAASGADSIIIDLEDAVTSESKPAALENALDWLGRGERAVVRVNPIATTWHRAEVEALAGTGAAIMLPKSRDSDELAALCAEVGARVIALVETPRGIRNAFEIAACAGVVRVALGNVDLAAELGVDPASQEALRYARGRLVMACADAGLAPPVDGVTTVVDRAEALEADIAAGRALGFAGKLCIHPRQVGYVNDGFRPTTAEVEWASSIIAAGRGGVSVVDGEMVDVPVLARARRIHGHSQTNG